MVNRSWQSAYETTTMTPLKVIGKRSRSKVLHLQENHPCGPGSVFIGGASPEKNLSIRVGTTVVPTPDHGKRHILPRQVFLIFLGSTFSLLFRPQKIVFGRRDMIVKMVVRHVRPKTIVRPSFLVKFHADLSAGHTQFSPDPARGTFDGLSIFEYPHQPIMTGRTNPLFTLIG